MSVPDPFVIISAERAYFRLEDLVRLHDRLKELRGDERSNTAKRVRQTLPDV
jgi:hypothetical protein